MKALLGIAQAFTQPLPTCCISRQSVLCITGCLSVFVWDKAAVCSAYLTTINVASSCDIKGNNACGIHILLCSKSQESSLEHLNQCCAQTRILLWLMQSEKISSWLCFPEKASTSSSFVGSSLLGYAVKTPFQAVSFWNQRGYF